MSSQWDPYIKSIKDNSQGNCDQATILGLNGGGSWISEGCPGVRLYLFFLHVAILLKVGKTQVFRFCFLKKFTFLSFGCHDSFVNFPFRLLLSCECQCSGNAVWGEREKKKKIQADSVPTRMTVPWLRFFLFFQGLKVSPDESAKLARAFSRKKYDEFRGNGIKAAGKKYIFLRTDDDDRIVIARCKDETLTMQKTKTGNLPIWAPYLTPWWHCVFKNNQDRRFFLLIQWQHHHVWRTKKSCGMRFCSFRPRSFS